MRWDEVLGGPGEEGGVDGSSDGCVVFGGDETGEREERRGVVEDVGCEGCEVGVLRRREGVGREMGVEMGSDVFEAADGGRAMD